MTVSLNPTASVYEQPSEPRSASGSMDMGQADFLKLMTTQLRNQDPFEPIENGEFLGQIAQFGTVSGIQELQQSFGDLSSALQANRALQASVLVGKQVMVNGNQAELAQDAVLRGAVELPSAVSDLHVQVLGGNGETLADIDLGSQTGGIVEFESAPSFFGDDLHLLRPVCEGVPRRLHLHRQGAGRREQGFQNHRLCD